MARRPGIWLAMAALWAASPAAAQQQHTAEVSALVFSGDGKALYSAARNGGVALLDPANAQVRQRTGAGSAVYDLALSHDGRTLAVACVEGQVRLLDVATLKEQRVLEAHKAAVAAVAFSPDG